MILVQFRTRGPPSCLRQPSSLDFNTPVEDANARTSFWVPLCKIWQGRVDFSYPSAEIPPSSPGGGKLNPNTIFLKILIKNKRILFFLKNIVFGFSFPPPRQEWRNRERGHQNDPCGIKTMRGVTKMTFAGSLSNRILDRCPQNEA